MGANPVFANTPKNNPATVTNADGTATKKTVLTAGAAGHRLDSLRVVSDDTADKSLSVYLTKAAVDYPLGTINVPAGAGTNGTTPWIEGLAELNADQILTLEAGALLKVMARGTAVSSGKTITVIAVGGDL